MKKGICILFVLILSSCGEEPMNSAINQSYAMQMELVELEIKTMEQVVADSTLIIQGKYESVASVETGIGVFGGIWYFTNYRIEVLDEIKGSVDKTIIDVRLKGTHVPYVDDIGDSYYYVPTVNEKREDRYYFDETIREDREYIFGLVRQDGKFTTTWMTHSIFLEANFNF